jgi:hypothetical protein
MAEMHSYSAQWMFYLASGLSGSIFEELITRGILLIAMMVCWKNQKNGMFKALVASSALLGIMYFGCLCCNGDDKTFIKKGCIIFGVGDGIDISSSAPFFQKK